MGEIIAFELSKACDLVTLFKTKFKQDIPQIISQLGTCAIEIGKKHEYKILN